ncbi:MAG: ribosomal RNA small subunit methyltransferase A [Bacilli bacterium]|nr:ribosomal RNA small subunit methyltransferase A [Bacilli bacterium]
MNINEVKQILTKYDVSVKKQFGQNFLMDNNIINKICDVSNVSKEVNVIEIGPGLGFLTQELKQRANKVMCYEIDPEMVKVVTNRFENDENVIIKYQDFLKANIDNDIEKYLSDKPVIVVANLPYYITTAILIKILEESKYIKQMTVMMQLEVADRICGKPSTKDYNSLSVLMQYYTTCKLAIKVGKMCFYPEPNVDSAVVLIKHKEEILNAAVNEEYFKKFNRIVFAQRRKTLANNLKSGFGYKKELIEEILIKNNIPLTIRTEALSVEQIVHLSNEFYLAQNK